MKSIIKWRVNFSLPKEHGIYHSWLLKDKGKFMFLLKGVGLFKVFELFSLFITSLPDWRSLGQSMKKQFQHKVLMSLIKSSPRPKKDLPYFQARHRRGKKTMAKPLFEREKSKGSRKIPTAVFLTGRWLQNWSYGRKISLLVIRVKTHT